HAFDAPLLDVHGRPSSRRFQTFLPVPAGPGWNQLGGPGVNDQKILGELFASRDEAARRIENQTAPVKYQLIVAADEIAVNQPCTRLRRQALQHVETGLMLAQLPRGRRDVKDDPRSGF